MNKKLKMVIKYILSAVITFAAAYFYSFVSYEESTAVFSGNEAGFTVKEGRLYRISIMLSVPDDTEGSIVIGIYDESGNEVRNIEKQAENISADSYTDLKFRKINTENESLYTLRIISAPKGVTIKDNSSLKYRYTAFRLQTMIVFILCIVYLVVLAKTLGFIFRK